MNKMKLSMKVNGIRIAIVGEVDYLIRRVN